MSYAEELVKEANEANNKIRDEQYKLAQHFLSCIKDRTMQEAKLGKRSYSFHENVVVSSVFYSPLPEVIDYIITSLRYDFGFEVRRSTRLHTPGRITISW